MENLWKLVSSRLVSVNKEDPVEILKNRVDNVCVLHNNSKVDMHKMRVLGSKANPIRLDDLLYHILVREIVFLVIFLEPRRYF